MVLTHTSLTLRAAAFQWGAPCTHGPSPAAPTAPRLGHFIQAHVVQLSASPSHPCVAPQIPNGKERDWAEPPWEGVLGEPLYVGSLWPAWGRKVHPPPMLAGGREPGRREPGPHQPADAGFTVTCVLAWSGRDEASGPSKRAAPEGQLLLHGHVFVPRGHVVSRLRARPGSGVGTCLRPPPVCRLLLRPRPPPGKVTWAPRLCQTASGGRAPGAGPGRRGSEADKPYPYACHTVPDTAD